MLCKIKHTFPVNIYVKHNFVSISFYLQRFPRKSPSTGYLSSLCPHEFLSSRRRAHFSSIQPLLTMSAGFTWPTRLTCPNCPQSSFSQVLPMGMVLLVDGSHSEVLDWLPVAVLMLSKIQFLTLYSWPLNNTGWTEQVHLQIFFSAV